MLVLTGHVLKDPDYVMDFHQGKLFASKPQELEPLRREPIVLPADVPAVMNTLEQAEQQGSQRP